MIKSGNWISLDVAMKARAGQKFPEATVDTSTSNDGAGGETHLIGYILDDVGGATPHIDILFFFFFFR